MAETQTRTKPVEHPQLDPSKGFDDRVHIKDAKTGKLIRIQHYARHAKGGEVMFERPPGSGNCFYENGQSAGRWRFTTKGVEQHWEKISDEHIAVAAAPANRLEELEQRNDALEKELAALQAEAEKQKG